MNDQGAFENLEGITAYLTTTQLSYNYGQIKLYNQA